MDRFRKTPMPPPLRTPKVPAKPAPTPQKPSGLFGDKGFRSFRDLRYNIQKAPDMPAPKSFRKIYKKERVELMDKLKKRAEASGKKFGISSKDLGDTRNRSSILGKMFQEEQIAKRQGKYKEAKELETERKIYEQWQKSA